MKINQATDHAQEVIKEVNRHILGKNDVVKQVMIALLAQGHVLFEDYPGLAKTMMCKTFAQALGCSFRRIQFTPDLLPQDITGSEVFNQKTHEFEFKKGPLFSNIILADEINRATPKTQSALLEAMAEYQISMGGKTYSLKGSNNNGIFNVVAT